MIKAKHFIFSVALAVIVVLSAVLAQSAYNHFYMPDGQSDEIIFTSEDENIVYSDKDYGEGGNITYFLPDSIRKERTGYSTVEDAMLADGSIGVLSIPSINLIEPVFESGEVMEDMKKGLAHFVNTSSFDGNVGLSGHNWTDSGIGACFKYLYQVQEGDTMTYRTALGEREYVVDSIVEISEKDWSYFSYTEENRLTLLTCINDKPTMRLIVQAVEMTDKE